MRVNPGYTFDDVLLVPKYSAIKSRTDVDTSVDLGKGVKLNIPIVSSNMKNVTGAKMGIEISSLGGLAILHRFYPDSNDQFEEFLTAQIHLQAAKQQNNIGVSVGVNDYKLIDTMLQREHGPNIICIDVAHGDSKACIDTTKYVSKNYPNVLLIAGNVATWHGAKALRQAGADVIKVGVGPGSICSTRIETGNGVPQLTALETIYEAAKVDGFKIIADGGIKQAGDIVKALCFSDCVMLGNLLAGTDEAPGDVIITDDGIIHKQYAGSSTHKTSHVEGVIGLVNYKGPVKNVINRLMEGVRSGLSYQGACNLQELKNNPEFVSISHAGLVESKPHDIKL